MEVRDPDRLLVEDLAGGREEVVGGFGAVVIDVSINAQGDAECAAAVGYCCEMDPRGSNLPLALAWYQHAAKAGSAWAMEKVATFYEEGYGCTANRALADACRETLKYMR